MMKINKLLILGLGILLFNKNVEIQCYKRSSIIKCNNANSQNINKSIVKEKICEYKIKSNALKKLYERKLINYISDLKNIDKILYENEHENEKKKSVYIGIDLNCKYLHIGSLTQLKTLEILRSYKTDVIILLGNSTTQIGDPSFQLNERKETLNAEICQNEQSIKESIIDFILNNDNSDFNEKDLHMKELCGINLNQISFQDICRKTDLLSKDEIIYKCSGKGNLRILKNNIWYDKMNVIDFLKYGEHFGINKLLRKESVIKKYQNKNLTLKDLNYISLQSYDFLHLFKKYKTYIQIGGSDQWGNIQSGIELCQNIYNQQLYGLTTNLLLYKNNIKFSKSLFQENKKLPIWIDKEYTSPYLFWNFLRNVEDQKVQSYIDMLTNLNINLDEELKNSNNENPKNIIASSYDNIINSVKKKMADHITNTIYGKCVVDKIHKINKIIKNNKFNEIENLQELKILPYNQININLIKQNKINITDVLKLFQIAMTNKEAKEKINQNCIYINTKLITNPKYILNIMDFLKTKNDNYYYVLLRLGKKSSYSIIAKSD
ncbi:tyrosine--tRNA ligase, putative [Plasmodium berghei]|uniref:tyrosine--tRNA ligase n=2 Tax=Plasmodium berghei TaxID=5821 RepID=A0A509AM06_PLABA|nr:tyrosine--tRNA ligase, putative [Plasmodium berghei ANKA]CXI44435.1 tyrosine--tRNA ligase, putative [Plasmodium berghei]SCM22503.1 tyrosine--tRNA ligase, putative [Plasmodium berghei]SCN25490.1 tyrosine--tRNA ligase, putative [Plasmodium berghei]SCO60448.1 tyrosine--tRNA ligase, putative [Plasmodium berghei]SCO62241.1 tyrosine--tRNA ligase, putative [Plasmodium berghei]|eukprot:XP_034421655.1 tyrosine--tRNA ligase, putative [Plasmodium berghei ANKA]